MSGEDYQIYAEVPESGFTNGTLFNQNYVICYWLFNFDCSTAEDIYSLNDDIAAEREALAENACDDQEEFDAPAVDNKTMLLGDGFKLLFLYANS